MDFGVFKGFVSRISMNNAFNDAADDVASTFVKRNIAANKAVNDFAGGLDNLTGDDLASHINGFAKSNDLSGVDLDATKQNINDMASRISGIDNVDLFGSSGNSYDYDTAYNNIMNASNKMNQDTSGFSRLNNMNYLNNNTNGSSIPGNIASNASAFGNAAADYLSLGDVRSRGGSLNDLISTGAARYGAIAGGIVGIDAASNLLSGNNGQYDNNY